MFKVLILLSLSLIVRAKNDTCNVPRWTLNDGNTIPALGLGTYEVNKTEYFINAIKIGYRAIDTAYQYGNEKTIGMALKEAFEEKLIKREDLFITTKIWSTSHSRGKALENMKEELRDLGLTYSDLALVHWPTGFKEDTGEMLPTFPNGTVIPRKSEPGGYLEAYQGLEDAQRMGLARSIGVANMNIPQLTKVLEIAKIKPAVNQFECHPDFNNEKLVKFCKDKGIQVIAYSPMGKANPELFNEPAIKEIAKKYNKSVAQVILRWNIQRNIIVIPRSHDKARQAENINIFDFELTDEEEKRICRTKQRPKLIVIPGIQTHPDFPFNENYNLEL